MMKKLLEENFGSHYGSTKRAVAECQLLKGAFALADQKACDSCQNTEGCDHVVLKCETASHEIEVIQLEKFIDNYSNLKMISNGMKCDLMLVADQKIVFCDMTCSYAKYIEPFTMKDGTTKVGKRAMVKKQVSNSIELLTGVPKIASAIEPLEEKIALFAYREKDEVKKDEFDTKTSMNMRKFGSIQEKTLSEPMFTDLDNGFMFTEVKYPNAYIW